MEYYLFWFYFYVSKSFGRDLKHKVNFFLCRKCILPETVCRKVRIYSTYYRWNAECKFEQFRPFFLPVGKYMSSTVKLSVRSCGFSLMGNCSNYKHVRYVILRFIKIYCSLIILIYMVYALWSISVADNCN